MPRSRQEMLPQAVRVTVSNELPLVPATYPGKPGPAHLVNNLLAFALGVGESRGSLVASLTDAEARRRLLGEGANDGDVRVFGDLLASIFDVDRSVYSAFASPFVLDRRFCGKDASDDRQAAGLWNAFGDEGRERLRQALFDFFRPIEITSGALGVLANMFEAESATPKSKAPTEVSWQAHPSTFGAAAARILASGLERASDKPIPVRIEVTRQFGVLVSAFVVLGSLFDACHFTTRDSRSSSKPSPQSASTILNLACFTGQTPGSPRDPNVMLAILSASATIRRAHEGIITAFDRLVQDAWAEFGKSDWERFAVEFSTKLLAGPDAAAFSQMLSSSFGDLPTLARKLLPFDHYQLMVKSLGGKAGFVLPRKNGQPRFVLESGFLTSLAGFVGEDDMTVEEFVQEVNRSLGLILGTSGLSSENLRSLNLVSGHTLDVERMLQQSEQDLASRMVAGGLARRFSDGSVVLRKVI